MAVARNERGEPCLPRDQAGPVAHQGGEAMAHVRTLDRLATHHGDRLGIVGHAREREAEVGFVALLVELEPDQRTADQVRDQRADAGIEQRRPDQIARERQIGAEQRHRRGRRQPPQDIGEGEQRNEGIEQPGAELVRALHEQQHVVADAQMDVVDRIVDEADAVVAALRHPHRDIALGQEAPPADDEGLTEEVLRHADRDGAERDEAEDNQFGLEGFPVARLQRVEEARVPMDHRDGDEHVAELAGRDAGQQQACAPALLRTEVGKGEREERAQPENDTIHAVPRR